MEPECGCIWGNHPEANRDCRYPALLKAAEAMCKNTIHTEDGDIHITRLYELEELQHEVDRGRAAGEACGETK